MANGAMGKKISEATRLRVLELLAKGNSMSQVALRLGVSTAFVRKTRVDEEECQAISQEEVEVPDDDINQDAEEST